MSEAEEQVQHLETSELVILIARGSSTPERQEALENELNRRVRRPYWRGSQICWGYGHWVYE